MKALYALKSIKDCPSTSAFSSSVFIDPKRTYLAEILFNPKVALFLNIILGIATPKRHPITTPIALALFIAKNL